MRSTATTTTTTTAMATPLGPHHEGIPSLEGTLLMNLLMPRSSGSKPSLQHIQRFPATAAAAATAAGGASVTK
jgi:hypothetical protein